MKINIIPQSVCTDKLWYSPSSLIPILVNKYFMLVLLLVIFVSSDAFGQANIEKAQEERLQEKIKANKSKQRVLMQAKPAKTPIVNASGYNVPNLPKNNNANPMRRKINGKSALKEAINNTEKKRKDIIAKLNYLRDKNCCQEDIIELEKKLCKLETE